MLIQLRQSEIEAALKMYVVSQGFSLNNKTVDISFTSGRKDNGVSADLEINETGVTVPAGPINRSFCVEPSAAPIALPQLNTPDQEADAVFNNEPEGECTDPPVAQAEVKSGASLFN
jgi:hypothetical protein